MAMDAHVLDTVKQLSKVGNYTALCSILQNPAHSQVVIDEGWTMVSSIFSHSDIVRLQEHRDDLIRALKIIAGMASPKLIVYAFLEQVELYADPFIVTVLSPALIVAITAIKRKQQLTIEVVIDALCLRLNQMAIPVDYCVTYHSEPEDQTLMARRKPGNSIRPDGRPESLQACNGDFSTQSVRDCLGADGTKQFNEANRESLNEIVTASQRVVDLMLEFIDTVSMNDIEFRDEYTKTVIGLLGSPLSRFLCDDNELRDMLHSLCSILTRVNHNILAYTVSCVSECSGTGEEAVRRRGLAFYHYLDYTGRLGDSALPAPYSRGYIFTSHIPLISQFLSAREDELSIHRGLRLLGVHIGHLLPESLSLDDATLEEFCQMSTYLCEVTTRCDVAILRQTAVALLEHLLSRFDARGRHTWIIILLRGRSPKKASDEKSVPQYISLAGHVIKLAQTEIARYWDTDNDYFDSPQLVTVLEHVFCWPPAQSTQTGAVSDESGTTQGKQENSRALDLVDMSDLIIPALTLLQFIIMRDTKKKRVFVVRLVREQFLKPLDSELNFSQRWYRSQLEELAAGRISDSSQSSQDGLGPAVDVAIGGQSLKDMPKQSKKDVLERACLKLDLIKFHLVRVQELVEKVV